MLRDWAGLISRNRFNTAALALLTLLTLLALVRPIVGYDGWWYHLPFSSYLWNIGGGEASFKLDPLLTQRWIGFPKLWEFVQGFCWYITGTLNAVVVPHLLLFGVYLTYVWRRLDVPIGYVILAFFASPMLLIHYECTHLDLAVGLCVALGFLVLTDLVLDAGADTPWRPWPRMLAVVVLFAVAGNIKYQGLFACVAVSAVIAVQPLGFARMVTTRRCTLLGILIVANLAAAAWTISNTLRFDDPFYPLRVEVAGMTLFDGPQDPNWHEETPSYILYGNTPARFPGPINFVLSATELDWTMRGVVPWYDIGSVTGNNPARGGPGRTGGWGGLFVLVNGWLLGMQLWRWRRLGDRRQRLLAGSAALLILATAFLPRAYELRYWLFLPLTLIAVNTRFMSSSDRDGKVAPHLLTAMVVYGIATAYLSPKSGLLEPHLVTQRQRAAEVPPDVRQALTATGRYCNPENDLVFRFSQASTGIAGVVSRIPGDCK